jgi:hypothetical protein
MKSQTNVKELLKELIARDPYIIAYLLTVKVAGIDIATYDRQCIIIQESPKEPIYLILDPWTEILTIRDEVKGTTYQFHINKVLKAMVELYGFPKLQVIRKFGIEMPLKNAPSNHQ